MIRRPFRAGQREPFAVWLLRLLLLPSLLLTAACGDVLGKSYPPYRYRLTVEVETPQGLRQGSSVIEVQTLKEGALSLSGGGAGGDVVNRVKGQAVAVDLPNGQTLFALLRSDWDRDWPATVFALQVPYPTQQEVAARSPDGEWNPQRNFEMWMDRIEVAHGVVDLPRLRKLGPDQVSAWPMFARFRVARDPRSIERVDVDHLPAVFGAGYKVHRICLERTDDRVTTGIFARLPKADAKGFYNSDGKLRANTLNDHVFGLDEFSRGIADE